MCKSMTLPATAYRTKFADWICGSRRSPAERILIRSLAIVTAVTVVTAYFSETFFQIDEHYQVLEFMSTKLGFTSPSSLPWEYGAHIRPWMQPFLYFLIAKPLIFVGVHDLFDVVFVLRLATDMASIVALAVFAKATLDELERADEKLFYATALPFLGYLPYLFVRTSSESLSGAVFTLAIALLMRHGRSVSLHRFAISGILCAMAFECRYQSAIFVLGLFFWLLLVVRARPAALCTFVVGGLVPVVAAIPIDHWGYGAWVFPPWNYLKINLLDNVAAQRFGSDPFYAYLYLFPAHIFLPIAVVLFAAMLITFVRNPWHVVTWVSAPYFLVHSLIAHKEERFLFPLAILATAYPVLAFAPSPKRLFPVFARVWAYRYSIMAKAVAAASVAVMLFLAVYPYGFHSHMPMAKYLYRQFSGGFTAYTYDSVPFVSYPMYRPRPMAVIQLTTAEQLEGPLAHGPVYVLSESPMLADGVLPKDARATLLFSEFPFAGFSGGAEFGAHAKEFYKGMDRKLGGLKLPDLAWMTLFQVERRSTAEHNAPSP